VRAHLDHEHTARQPAGAELMFTAVRTLDTPRAAAHHDARAWRASARPFTEGGPAPTTAAAVTSWRAGDHRELPTTRHYVLFAHAHHDRTCAKIRLATRSRRAHARQTRAAQT
jgi:hypothetical protein